LSASPETDVGVWRRVAEAGIQTLRIPTPFMVGRVNCYVIEDDPLTLVDTGPNSGKALDELEHQLAAVGHSIEAIELILVTHQHSDHLGLLDIVANRSGAEVATIDRLVPYIENFGDDAERDDADAAELMLRNGIPEETVTALRQVSGSFRVFGSRAKVTRPLRDGEPLEFRDRSLETQLRPGHSPSDTLFWDERRRILLAGDHLIKHISSNPLVSRPLDGSNRRRKALVEYLRSLQQTRALPADIVLAGHGEPIDDHVALIDDRFRMHQRRAEKLYSLLREKPQSAHELAQALWGDVAVTQAFLTLSEVIGHLDLLVDAGHVRETERDGVIVYEATGSTPRDELGDLIPGGNPARAAG
jgi:glyoxylase-like metal-dependent hydrolase (beta-lactamase superfamily II)